MTAPIPGPSPASAPTSSLRSAKVLRQLHRWHWISSAFCLVAMIFFAVTGITLNHAGDIRPHLSSQQTRGSLPPALLAMLAPPRPSRAAPLPLEIRNALGQQTGFAIPALPADWDADSVALRIPGPGSEAMLTINLPGGEFLLEQESRGAVAFFNDLHKGRHTGPLWHWLLDGLSVMALIFCFTGLLLLAAHGRHRPATWPLVSAGLALPLLLIYWGLHA